MFSLLDVHQATLESSDNCLRSIGHIEPHQDDADVAFNSRLGNAKVGCNLLIASTANDELQDFALTNAEVRVRDA